MPDEKEMPDEKDKPRALHAEEIDAVVEAARNVLNSKASGAAARTWAYDALNLVETLKAANHEGATDRQTLAAVRGVLKCGQGQEVAALDKLNGEHDEYARQLRHIRADLDRAGFRHGDDYYEAPNGVRLLLGALGMARAAASPEARESFGSVLGKLDDVRAALGDRVTVATPVAAVRELCHEFDAMRRELDAITEAVAAAFAAVPSVGKTRPLAESVMLLHGDRRILLDRANRQADELRAIADRIAGYDFGEPLDVYANVAEGVRRLAALFDLETGRTIGVAAALLDGGFLTPGDHDLTGAVNRVFDSLGEARADSQRVSDVVAVLVRQGITYEYDTNINAVGAGVARLADKFNAERRYARRLVDELRGREVASVYPYAENLARVLGLDPDNLDERTPSNVLAHVTSLVADKGQLTETLAGVGTRLGIKYEGDLSAFLNSVEALGTTLALWRSERASIAASLETEYGQTLAAHDGSLAKLVFAVLAEWQAYGQGECRKICALLDAELIDGESLPDRVQKLVTLLREAEGAKERLHAELAEAQTTRDGHAASLDMFVRESCELVELIAGAGIARGMLAPMVEKLVNLRKRDAALLRQVVEVLAEHDLALKHEDVTNVVGRVRTLADKRFRKDLAPGEREALGKLLTATGAPAHGLTLVERLRWLARQRDNYREHATGRGMFAEQQNRKAYEALRAAGVSPALDMAEGIEQLAHERSLALSKLAEANKVITERFGSSGIVAETLTLVERLEGAARIADIRQENDRIMTDTMLDLERHWSRFCKKVERIRAEYVPAAFPSRLSAHEIAPFIETLATHAKFGREAVEYLSTSSHYRPRASLNIAEAVRELDNAFEAARVLNEESRETTKSIAALLGCEPSEVVWRVRDLVRGAAGAQEALTCHGLLDTQSVVFTNSLPERIRNLITKLHAARGMAADFRRRVQTINGALGAGGDDRVVTALAIIGSARESLGVVAEHWRLDRAAATVRDTQAQVLDELERIDKAFDLCAERDPQPKSRRLFAPDWSREQKVHHLHNLFTSARERWLGFRADLDKLAAFGLEMTVEKLAERLRDYRDAERALRVAGMFEGETLTDAVRSLGTRYVNAVSAAEVVERTRAVLNPYAVARGFETGPVEGMPEVVERLVQDWQKLVAETQALDDAFGFGRNPGNDRIGALHDMTIAEASFRNSLAEALGVQSSDDLVRVAAATVETRNKQTDTLERLNRILQPIDLEIGDQPSTTLVEALEKFVAYHGEVAARRWSLESAAFDEWRTARDAFMFAAGDFDDVGEQGRQEAFGRWYAERKSGESKHVGVDRRKFARAAFEAGVKYAVGFTPESDPERAGVFADWYAEFTGEKGEAKS